MQADVGNGAVEAEQVENLLGGYWSRKSGENHAMKETIGQSEGDEGMREREGGGELMENKRE